MKKSLIALAVAATVATPMAASAATLQAAEDQDAISLYGSVRPQFVSGGDESISDGGSRFGVMGDHDLGNGQSSFFRIESKVSTSNAVFGGSGRLAYAGLKGGWGAVAGGQQWTPYYTNIASPHDIFASNGLGNYTGPGFASNALSYALPSGMAIGGAIATVINGDVADADGVVADEQNAIDAISAALTAQAGPVVIGLGVHDDSATDRTRVGLSLTGNFGPVGLGFLVEDTDPAEGEGGSTPWAITGQWMGIGLQYQDTDQAVDNTGWTLGYMYKLSGNTRVQFSYGSNDWTEDDKFVARYRVDF